jgi:hypothetical protein
MLLDAAAARSVFIERVFRIDYFLLKYMENLRLTKFKTLYETMCIHMLSGKSLEAWAGGLCGQLPLPSAHTRVPATH